jgi:predicted small metal-binding protein
MAVEFRCADVGVACKATTTAATADELVAKVGAHAKKVHGVELNQTLIAYAVTKVRGAETPTAAVRPADPAA